MKRRIAIPDAPKNARPRLPVAPPATYDPPPKAPQLPPPPVVSVGGDVELARKTVAVPTGGGINGLPEVTIYTTQKSWRACDVFVMLPFVTLGGNMITFRVYARNQGFRSLVATGRLGPQLFNPAPITRWIAAARAGAEQFEVTLDSNFTPAIAGSTVEVVVVASNDESSPEVVVGDAPFTQDGLVATASQAGLIAPDADVVQIEGVQNVAGPRFLLLFDKGGTNVVANDVPICAFGFRAGIGETVSRMFPLRGRRFSAGPRLSVSVNATKADFTGVVANDVAYQLWFR